MPKVDLIYETETSWNERTELVVKIDGVEVARGGYGGEPEDNTHYRDYDWVRSANETVAQKLGAEVVLSAVEVKSDL